MATGSRLVGVKREVDRSLAQCRDISSMGMRLNVSMSIEVNEPVSVVLSPEVSLPGRIAWMNGNECGIAFDQEIDSAALMDGMARAGKVIDHEPAALGDSAPKRGIRLAQDRSFRPGLNVKLVLQSGREERAVLHWTKDNFAELVLLA